MPSPDPSTETFNREILPVLVDPKFRALCRKLANRLTTFADADDFVQAASLRAWSARASYIPGSNARAWCHVIAKNHAINALNKRKREQHNMGVAVNDPSFADAHLTYRTPGLPSGVTMDTSAPIEDQLDTSTEWEFVAADIDDLPEAQQRAIMFHAHGVKDTDHEDSPWQTIGVRRHRGLARLRAVA